MNLTLLFAILASLVAPAAPADPLEGLVWLAGCWSHTSPRAVTTEMWMPPSGGLMMGAGRSVANGQARGWEHLRLRADGDAVVYTAVPSGQSETEFRSTVVTSEGFVVENPAHDFPQRISYQRTGPDSFTARVEGPGENGPTGFDQAFERVACEVPTSDR